MKFLCDRCKTRYSIGDDRVRGKILKIRCKNCANVITVREGMSVDESAAPGDRNRPTTAAPIGNAAPATAGALASAFASQSAKPPPALEEEWYVSIDGDQSGPYSLADAQRWISNKSFDADVHCWSEGFDDWLPVDKVSHFRGLRKKPAPPTAPPPLPRSAPGRSGAAAATQMRAEDLSEPKPLFAATMASIEKAAGIPPSPQTPPNGVPGMIAKANGTGSAQVPAIRAKSPAIPAVAAPTAAVNKNGSGPNRQSTVQGLGTQALAFDSSESATTGGESLTSVDAPAYEAKKQPAPVPEPDSDGTPDEDDSLDIGEVSRVVKLADLARMGNAPRNRTRPVEKLRMGATGSTPKLDPASLGLGGADAVAPIATPEPVAEPVAAAPVVAQAHRRGLIMLIGVAAVLLVGVAVLLVVMMQKNDADSAGGLGTTRTIDTERPEELVLHQLPNQQTGDGSAAVKIKKPTYVAPQQHPGGSDTADTGEGKGDKLKSDEIEDMARKQSAGTQRCYMRAQRGAEGIEIADLKKLSVTLTVDKTGVVTDVTLNEHGADSLGQCLIGQIKRWKFRDSPGGLFRIILAFAS